MKSPIIGTIKNPSFVWLFCNRHETRRFRSLKALYRSTQEARRITFSKVEPGGSATSVSIGAKNAYSGQMWRATMSQNMPQAPSNPTLLAFSGISWHGGCDRIWEFSIFDFRFSIGEERGWSGKPPRLLPGRRGGWGIAINLRFISEQ
jgi:hypothetical protein